MTHVANRTSSGERTPLIVGIGGTDRPESSSERVLRFALDAAERKGAATILFGARELDLPMYSPTADKRSSGAVHLIDALAAADGVIIASPGYHAGISGLVKNALDYIEDLRDADRPYLDGRAVGCIVTAQGGQAAMATLMALRSVVHALRGWPTPLAVDVNTAERLWDDHGNLVNERCASNVELMVEQVLAFAGARRLTDAHA
ncbi:NAD(P)H-dependent oxidoreductase [Rhodococcus olei]